MLFSRRKFLCGATATTLMLPSFMRALAQEADAATNTIIVIVQMDGGNDGYNTIIPISTTAYGSYLSQRSSIAVAESSITQAQTGISSTVTTSSAQATEFAMHPQLGNINNPTATNTLRALYGQGRVAVLMGVGIPQTWTNVQDHSTAQSYWDFGASTISVTGIGWLGGAIDQINGGALSMVALDGWTHACMNATSTNQFDYNGDITNYNIWFDPILVGGNGYPALAKTDAYMTANASSELGRSTSVQAVNFISQIQGYATNVPASDYTLTMTSQTSGAVTNPSIKSQLKQVARMIIGGSPTRAYLTSLGNFDFHITQNAYQPDLLQQTSESIAEFYAYLKAHGVSENVIIMTTSEFGRRAYVNSSAGTDHGSSSVNFLIGDRVTGGLYGEYPNLAASALDSSGNVPVACDYRSFLSAAISYVGGNPSTILGSGFELSSSAFPGMLS